MNKPLLVFQAPVATRSGYGDHSRDILKSLFELDKYDVKIVPTRWGNTPQDQINPQTEFGKKILENIVTKVDRQIDIFIQVSVANEFKKVGKYNIGITAGVETTVIPKEFIDGANKMDLILVPSKFTKSLFDATQYQEQDKQTKQVIRTFKTEKPVEVLFEGVDIERYVNYPKSEVDILEGIETNFNFLFVGHWLKGKLGEDRKDVGMLIKTFSTVFKYLPKDKRPGLILKTSHAGFSVIDRENIREKIENVIKDLSDVPPIYLLHGDLSDTEMAQLYNHPKVKAMVSFTKGEGYGRPLAEFATTGKPMIVSNWSGQGLFWSMITLFISIFVLFIPIEFFGSYKIINSAFKDLLINIVTVIVLSLVSLFLFQMLLNGENLFINEYLKIARATSFSGFITVPLVLFILHNFSKNVSFLNKYSFSIVLLIWVLSSQLFI